MSITLQAAPDDATWNSFVNASAHGSVFCRAEFVKALGEDHELLMLAENGNPKLGAVVIKQGGQPIRAPYPMTMYQGVICCGDFQAMNCHKRSKWLLEHLTFLFAKMEERYDRISFCLFHKFDDLRGFQWFNYHEPQLGTFKIDLRYTGILELAGIQDFETYLTMVRAVRRQEYRKALGEGFTVEMSTDIDLLNGLHKKTFERQGIVRGGEEEQLLLNITGTALENGFGELLVCRDKNGNPASATLFLYDQHYGYYLISANDPDYRKSGCGTFLMMENIRRCLDKGLSGVDFVGINSPNRGDFKTSFNARPVPYYVVSWDRPILH
jgi:lipid II:glycine glycyltransferase (peptidoglycan interpeptide bridge formation enzyme)